MRAVRRTHRMLRSKASLIMFPRNTHAFAKRVKCFGGNTFRLTSSLRLPMMPLAVVNSFGVLPHANNFMS